MDHSGLLPSVTLETREPYSIMRLNRLHSIVFLVSILQGQLNRHFLHDFVFVLHVDFIGDVMQRRIFLEIVGGELLFGIGREHDS